MHKPVGPCALPPTEAVGEKSCWACLTTIPAAAQVCFACGTRIEGIQCQACMAFCPEGARLCRCCGSPFNRERQNPVLSESLLIEADAVATLLLQFSLNPQRVLVESEQMTLTSFSFFGFAANQAIAMGKGSWLFSSIWIVMGFNHDRNTWSNLRGYSMPVEAERPKIKRCA